jgi:Alr-MurF fusion protein
LKLKRHKTILEINLSALRHNISIFKSFLLPKTKILAMVKAQSYGAGLEKIGLYLEHLGVDKLGVAYSDEGLELRKAGVKIPILVMNPEEDGFETCIRYQLEPAIYSFEQLNDLTHELIASNIQDFPIHLKIDTGMNRLGFETTDVQKLIEYIQAQPEIKIASVYSHLADADNRKDLQFTKNQISKFKLFCQELQQHFQNFYMHLLNSEGIVNYSSSQFDMVRVGIGMYGISKAPEISKKLLPVLKWKSVVSQIKVISKGESVGYSCSFVADKSYTIAIIPLGYADGFKRSLSNGNGGVFIQGNYCPTVGRVCMDMIMVDISNIYAEVGEEVEIIGENQQIGQLAEKLDTIPYEIMTSISNRVHRVYIEE